jgi:hypothetical protein
LRADGGPPSNDCVDFSFEAIRILMFAQRSVDGATRLDDQLTNGADFISQLVNDALLRLYGRLHLDEAIMDLAQGFWLGGHVVA